MDIGAQTLAQLSLENKEAKFITIEMGSKISGYTKDYLERLCRLNKISYRIWNNGAFVIELESLLKETHTILLSYEGITFVDKSELTDPTPQVVGNILSSALSDVSKSGPMQINPEDNSTDENTYGVGSAQPVPRFAGNAFGTKSLAFVGRAVVSDPEHPGQDIALQMTTPHAFVERQITMDEDLPKQEVKEVVEVPKQEIKKEVPIEAKVAPAPIADAIRPAPQAIHHSVHIPISPSDAVKLPIETRVEATSHIVTHIPVASDKVARTIVPERPIEEKKKAAIKADEEWDNMILGQDKTEVTKVELAEPVRISKADTPSPYRPIKTSVDATEHHDDGMLFPPIKLGMTHKDTNDVSIAPQAGQKVVVFAPDLFPGHAASSSKAIKTDVMAQAGKPPTETKTAVEKIIGSNPTIAQLAKLEANDLAILRNAAVPMKSEASQPLAVKQPLPLMRVMPQLPMEEKKSLPMKSEEHHMLVHEAHPLMKSVGFNVAAVMLVGSTFVLAGGVLTGDLGGKLNTASYVAGVSQAFGASKTFVPPNDVPLPTQTLPAVESDTKTVNMLPFSNDVVVTDGEKPNSVVVQPVFDDGRGKAYQYDIVPMGDSASSSNTN